MEDSVNRRFEIREEEDLVLSRKEEENPLDRLLDKLIVCHIFDKIPDSKCLLKCTLVCKRFSSLVYQASVISLILLPKKPNLAERFRRWTGNFFGRKDDGFKTLVELCDIQFLRKLMFNFLKNFKELKHVHIEFDSLRKLRGEPLIIWRLDCQSDSLVMLLAKNLDSSAKASDGITTFYMSRAVQRVGMIYWILLIVRMVCYSQRELKNVVFTVSENEGTLVLGEKGSLYFQNHTRNFRDFIFRTWYAPKLELPSCGRVMEDVMLCVFKGDEMADDFLIAEKLGEGKEKIYSEAAIEMLKKEVRCQKVYRSETFSFMFNEVTH